MNVDAIVRLKEGERVLRVVRQSWVAHAIQIVVSSLLIAAPFFFMVPLFAMGIPGAVGFVVTVMLGVAYAARSFHVWYWNAFLITNYRVVDIDQRGLFNRTVSEATYDKVQDVSYHITGIIGTLFRLGTLVIQTAGTTTNLELSVLYDPKDIHHLITATMQSFQSHLRGGARSEKVAHLLEAASDLSDAEARAFLVALQEAVAQPPSLGWKTKDVEGAMLSADEKGGENEEDGG